MMQAKFLSVLIGTVNLWSVAAAQQAPQRGLRASRRDLYDSRCVPAEGVSARRQDFAR